MKVIIKKPGCNAELIDIENSLKSLQYQVGGTIEATYPFEDLIAIIVNDEGKLQNHVEFSLALAYEGEVYDILAGTILIVGLSDDDFDSIPQDLADEYISKINYSERNILANSQIIPVIDIDK